MNMYRTTALLALSLLFVGPILTLGETQPKEETEFTAIVGADGVQRAEIIGGSYYFKPANIVLKVNVPVELKVRKEAGVTPHDIVVKAPEAGIEFSVNLADKAKSITFTPTKVGKYPMYCNKRFLFFASHRERGMEGVLDVRD